MTSGVHSSSHPILCICASFGRTEAISKFVDADLFPERYLSSTNPSEELSGAKESGKPIVLVVLGPMGHEGIKYLCDDYDKPAAHRRVRWIHSVSAGIDWYRLDMLTKEAKGIPLTNGKGGYSYLLGLHVVYSILYFNRETARFQANRAARRWDMFDMVEPRGCKVGILGYGDIGHAAARMLQPMEMRLTGVRRTESQESVDEYGVTLLSGNDAMGRVIEESDVVVNILPATKETKGLFSREMFARMKPNAVYINVGRGSTQNDAHLAEALQKGIIHGASLDVFETEPLPPESPLWDVGDDKLLFTSHNACISADSFRNTVQIFIDSARAYLKTGRIVGYMPDVACGY